MGEIELNAGQIAGRNSSSELKNLVPESVLKLSPALFDRMHVRRSRRQIRDFDRRVLNGFGNTVRREIRRVIENNVKVFAELVLECSKKSDRDLTRKRVGNFGYGRLAGLGDRPKKVEAFVRFLVREQDAFTARKPRWVQIAADRFSRLIDCNRRTLFRK